MKALVATILVFCTLLSTEVCASGAHHVHSAVENDVVVSSNNGVVLNDHRRLLLQQSPSSSDMVEIFVNTLPIPSTDVRVRLIFDVSEIPGDYKTSDYSDPNDPNPLLTSFLQTLTDEIVSVLRQQQNELDRGTILLTAALTFSNGGAPFFMVPAASPDLQRVTVLMEMADEDTLPFEAKRAFVYLRDLTNDPTSYLHTDTTLLSTLVSVSQLCNTTGTLSWVQVCGDDPEHLVKDASFVNSLYCGAITFVCELAILGFFAFHRSRLLVADPALVKATKEHFERKERQAAKEKAARESILGTGAGVSHLSGIPMVSEGNQFIDPSGGAGGVVGATFNMHGYEDDMNMDMGQELTPQNHNRTTSINTWVAGGGAAALGQTPLGRTTSRLPYGGERSMSLSEVAITPSTLQPSTPFSIRQSQGMPNVMSPTSPSQAFTTKQRIAPVLPNSYGLARVEESNQEKPIIVREAESEDDDNPPPMVRRQSSMMPAARAQLQMQQEQQQRQLKQEKREQREQQQLQQLQELQQMQQQLRPPPPASPAAPSTAPSHLRVMPPTPTNTTNIPSPQPIFRTPEQSPRQLTHQHLAPAPAQQQQQQQHVQVHVNHSQMARPMQIVRVEGSPPPDQRRLAEEADDQSVPLSPSSSQPSAPYAATGLISAVNPSATASPAQVLQPPPQAHLPPTPRATVVSRDDDDEDE